MTSENRSEADRVPESELRYQLLLEQLPAIVYTEDLAGPRLQVVYVNPRVRELLGISPEEWLADPDYWLDNVHPDDRAMVEAENERVEATAEPFNVEYRMLARDGRVVWFHDEARLVFDDEGRPRFWQGVMIDITARKEAEASHAEAEARYRALVEQTPVITYIDAIEGSQGTLYISPQTTTMLGYTPEAWYEDPDLWSKIVHPEDGHRDDYVDATGQPVSSEYRLIAKDGRVVWVHDQARLISDEQGNPKYWQGVLIDVTAQKEAARLQRDLALERRTSERLRAEDELKNTFLQAVSHDLRTPLAAILGLAVTLEREDIELQPAESRDMARRIAQSARKLDTIVSDFLDLERLQRGLAVPLFETVDVGHLVRDMVANSDLVTQRRLQLDTAPLPIRADPTMVERIVENLLANTVKYTPGDSRIWVRVDREEGGALITVEDDGPGVAPEVRDLIFQPFLQGRGAGAGSGVGLALVRRFAELHEGRAWVQERSGGGASFRVFLPAEPSPQPEGEGVVDLREEGQRTGRGSSSEASQA